MWLDYVKAFADETHTDAYGNAVAILNPKGSPRIMVAGHADEIGFMVHYISDDGFLYVVPIGGPDVALARGQRVNIHNRHGSVRGVTGSLAIHMQDRGTDQKAPKVHELFIDIGVSSKAEALELVEIGDPVTYVDQFEVLRGDVIISRACDNRVGTFAAAEVIRTLSTGKVAPCVIAVSNIQEENGLYGAAMTGYSLKPDAALVVDVGQATDIPVCSKPRHGDQRMGKGPILSVGSANHPVLVERLRTVAARKKIPFQMGVDSQRSGTDADAIFISRGGIPCATIGVPNRYMHTPVEMVHLGDLENIVRLISDFVRTVKSNEMFKVKI